MTVHDRDQVGICRRCGAGINGLDIIDGEPPCVSDERDARAEAADAYRASTGWGMAEGHAIHEAFEAGAVWAASRPASPVQRPTEAGGCWGSYVEYVRDLEAAVAVSPATRETVSIPRPVVPHGPAGLTEDEATAQYLRIVAKKIDHGYVNVGGSNVTATVRKLLLDAAAALTEKGAGS